MSLRPDRTESARQESGRLAALARYGILGTGREEFFDDIVALAADICEAPVALVNFVTADRQWFKAEVGIGLRELPLQGSICRYAMREPDLFVLPDIDQDSRFGPLGALPDGTAMHFYAAAPLRTPEGLPLGTVCVADTQPRPEGLTERQQRLLRGLARQVMAELGHRQALGERDTARAAHLREAERRRDEERRREREVGYRDLFERAAVGVARVGLDGRFLEVNDRYCAIVGHPREALLSKGFQAITHPDDLEGDLVRAEALLEGRIDSYALEKRYVTLSGEAVWANLTVGLLRHADGAPACFVSVIEDISERRRSEDGRSLLVGELNHRVKNLFAVVGSMVTMTARSARSPEEMARALSGRIQALARAHDLIGGDRAEEAVDLRDLLATVMAPLASDEARLWLDGPPLAVGDASATALVLVFHEFATNAAKYGALSRPGGAVTVEWWRQDERLVLCWREQGGPSVAEPERSGFGSKLGQLTVEGQLGGIIEWDWRPEGLRIVLDLPLSRLAA